MLETLLDSNVQKKYRKKLKRKYKKKKSEVGVLVTDLNYYILLENSGVSQCNEVQKELCNGKTANAKKSDFTQR